MTRKWTRREVLGALAAGTVLAGDLLARGDAAPAPKLQVAQLGTTHEHAGAKIRSMRLRPDVFEIVGVVEDDSKPGPLGFEYEKRLKTYEGVPRLTEKELFALPGLDAVFVETTNVDLVSAAERCLAHGFPIHMDKPGGNETQFDAFVRLRREYEKRGLAFQMGYMFRGNPAMQWIRRAAGKGWLGEIFDIQANMSHDYGGDAYQDYIATFRGGIMHNLGGHLVDFVVPLLGRPEKVVSILKTAPGDAPGVFNNGLAILEYPRATATLRVCSREVGGHSRRRLKVCGTKGTVELSPLERFDGKPLLMDVSLREDNEELKAGRHTLPFGPVRNRYEAQLLDFAQEIRGELKKPNIYDSRHDILVQEILLAASGLVDWKFV